MSALTAGVPVPGTDSQGYVCCCCRQVFPTSGYQALFDGLKQTTEAGGPTYHLANYTVLTNAHQGIFGGWQVRF